MCIQQVFNLLFHRSGLHHTHTLVVWMCSVLQGNNSHQNTDQRAQLGLFSHRNVLVDILGNHLNWILQQSLVSIKTTQL